jgi:plasmid stabilization system protein ParE
MSGYQLTPQALDDLDAANRVEEAIHIACAFLADAPLAGRIREDLTALPVRFWLVQPYRNHWIIYNPQSKPLQVIRIIHGARNIPAVLP